MADNNPFIVSGKISQEYFCDREKETEKLTKCITNQENVVLTSQRRMGKTKLVEHCFGQDGLEDKYIVIFTDILHTTTLREFIRVLGHAVYKRIAKRSDRLTKLFVSTMKSLSASFGYDTLQNIPTFDIKLGDIGHPEYTIDEIFEYIEQADKRCIIIIDEFQQVTKYPEKNVEALLRSHIQNMGNANFIFAGSQRHIMEDMFLSNKRPFYMSATLLQLDPIDIEKYEEFALHHFHSVGKDIAKETIRLAYNTFNGVTLYVQRVMHDAWAGISAGETCTEMQMSEIIENFIEESSPRLREQMSYITESQKELLYAVASDAPVRSITSSAFVKRHNMKSPSAVQAAAKKLLEYDLITRRDGEYCIADPLLMLWMKS